MMAAYATLSVLAAATLSLLWLLGLRGTSWTLAAAALAFGAAGYALTGRPGLAGAPRAASDRPAPQPLTDVRHALMGRFDTGDRWMTIAQGYASRGQTQDAVGLMRSAVREHPLDYALWVGLGNALSDHARTISPAARFAYARAIELAPGHPGPRFFLGLALVRSGEREEGLRMWRELLAAAPAEASWRPRVENALLIAEAMRR